MTAGRWPLHPLPVEGECLTSWLYRIARLYKFSLTELLQHDLSFAGDPKVLDYAAPHSLIGAIADRTGVSYECIRTMTFEGWTPWVFDGINEGENDFDTYARQHSVLLPDNIPFYQPPKGWRPWFSTGHSKHYACRACFTSDSAPILRLVWMLPLMLSCPIHHKMLEPCRRIIGYGVLWDQVKEASIPLSKATHALDQRTWQALTQGFVTLPNRSVHAAIWFRMLRTLLYELNIPLQAIQKNQLHMRSIWQAIGDKTRAGGGPWKPFEALSDKRQRSMLRAAATAMEMIEEGMIQPRGNDGLLFIKKPTDEGDLPSSYPFSEKHIDTATLVWHRLSKALDAAVKSAKQDTEVARELHAFVLMGRRDSKTVSAVDALFTELEIPLPLNYGSLTVQSHQQ